MSTNNIDWNDVVKKEARGNDDEDFGEVQDIQGNYVLVQKGIINKEKFYIPKDRAESYDGTILKLFLKVLRYIKFRIKFRGI